jgi:hypothetical protein
LLIASQPSSMLRNSTLTVQLRRIKLESKRRRLQPRNKRRNQFPTKALGRQAFWKGRKAQVNCFPKQQHLHLDGSMNQEKFLVERLLSSPTFESYGSFHKALCYAPELDQNALLERTQPSHHSFNSFRVYHLVCRMDSDCKFCARLFYPIENVDGSSNEEDLKAPPPTAKQKSSVKKTKHTSITNLFPTKCLPEVKNQITGYWRNRRRDLLKNIHPSNHELRYLPQLDAFRHRFGLKLPKGYQVPPGSVLATMVSPTLLRRFANSIIVGGGNSTLTNPQVDKDSVQPPEHTMVILPLAPVDDPFVGHIPKNILFVFPQSIYYSRLSS